MRHGDDLFPEPRVLQCLPASDPTQRIEARHLANEILELRVHRMPPAEGRSLLVPAVERTEESYETLDKGILLSSVVLDETTEVVEVVDEMRYVEPEYYIRRVLSLIRLVREEYHPIQPDIYSLHRGRKHVSISAAKTRRRGKRVRKLTTMPKEKMSAGVCCAALAHASGLLQNWFPERRFPRP